MLTNEPGPVRPAQERTTATVEVPASAAATSSAPQGAGRRRRRRWALGVVVTAAGVLVIAGCGDDDTTTPTPTTGAEADAGGDGSEVSELDFTAVDIDFERDEVRAQPGVLEVTLVNQGAIEHSWVVEGHEEELRLYTQQSGATDEGTLTLPAGTFTYYCDISGHRAAGMEGTLTLG